MLIQQEIVAPPPLPWWVMYIAILALAYAAWRMTLLRWWGGCLTAAAGWVLLFLAGALTMPGERVGLVLLLPFIPLAAFLFALLRGRERAGPSLAAAGPRLRPPALQQLSPAVMQGQPSARAVLRSKVMVSRYAAGMPRDAVFVARLRYVSGLGDLHPQPVDLFMGGAKLWAAPLDARLQPAPIPARDVLRVDVWPELEGPPTLRVNFSPPAGDLTRDLVLGIMPNVPPQLVTPQLEAIAGVLTGLFRAEREAEELAGDSPAPADLAADAPPPSSSGNRYCSRCGETVPPGATACPRCAQPV